MPWRQSRGGSGCALRGGARVGGTARGVEASHVDDAYAERVVVQTVGAGFAFGTPGLDGAIEEHYVVIAYAAEAACAVPAVDVGGAEVLPGFGGRAVNDDFSDVSHILEDLHGKVRDSGWQEMPDLNGQGVNEN